jgi:CHASE3 domain sensor protein
MKVKIGTKLGVGFAILMALMVVSAVLSYIRLGAIKENNVVMIDVRVPTMEALRTMQDRVDYAGSKARQVILAGSQAERRQKAEQAFDEAWE